MASIHCKGGLQRTRPTGGLGRLGRLEVPGALRTAMIPQWLQPSAALYKKAEAFLSTVATVGASPALVTLPPPCGSPHTRLLDQPWVPLIHPVCAVACRRGRWSSVPLRGRLPSCTPVGRLPTVCVVLRVYRSSSYWYVVVFVSLTSCLLNGTHCSQRVQVEISWPFLM